MSRGPGPARPVRIGLTGPIGCGKSTVAALAREPGRHRHRCRRGRPRRHRAGRHRPRPRSPRGSGPSSWRADGALDRAALGRIVFADPAALRDLEAIVHPAVRPPILAALDAARTTEAPAVVIEAIKLVEGGFAELCDEVWLVTCSAAGPARRAWSIAAWIRPTPTGGSRPRATSRSGPGRPRRASSTDGSLADTARASMPPWRARRGRRRADGPGQSVSLRTYDPR